MGGYLLFPLQVTWNNHKALLLQSVFKLFLAESFCPRDLNRTDQTFLSDLARLGWEASPPALPQPGPRRGAAVRQGEQMSLPWGRRQRGGGKGPSAVRLPRSHPAVGNPTRNLGDLIPQMGGFHFYFCLSRLFLKKNPVTRLCRTVACTMST